MALSVISFQLVITPCEILCNSLFYKDEKINVCVTFFFLNKNCICLTVFPKQFSFIQPLLIPQLPSTHTSFSCSNSDLTYIQYMGLSYPGRNRHQDFSKICLNGIIVPRKPSLRSLACTYCLQLTHINDHARNRKRSISEVVKLGNPFVIEVINEAPSPQNEKPLGTCSELYCCNFIQGFDPLTNLI